jgi:hypothetical protein
MPGGGQLRRQARQIAAASVPTRRSITRQYGREQADVGGFTRAVLTLLGQGPGVGAAYAPEVAQQQKIDAAARVRLQALGGAYGAGSAAAVGGMGDSAASRLLSQQAAAQAYGAQLPHVAAARGALAEQGLISNMNEALRQRAEGVRQALPGALQQVENTALARSQLIGNLQNQRFQQQLASQQLALQRESQGERVREFNRSQDLEWARLRASIAGPAGVAAGSGRGIAGPGFLGGFQGLGRVTGLTANEVSGRVRTANGVVGASDQREWVNVPVHDDAGKITGYRREQVGGTGRSPDFARQGYSFGQAMQALANQGVEPAIALYVAGQIYDRYRGVRDTRRPEANAYLSFVRWMAEHGYPSYQRRWDRLRRSSAMPVTFRGGPH